MIQIWTKLVTKTGWITRLSSRVNRLLLAISLLAGSSLAFLPTNPKFIYTVNGQTVVRRSELGPLTPATSNDPTAHLPGHDYGVIGDPLDLAITLPAAKQFSYMVHGEPVVRRSELGPMSIPVYAVLAAK